MMEIIIAVVSAIIGLFIYNRVQKSNSDSGQRQLEIKSKVIEQQVKDLQSRVDDSKKEEDNNVKQIKSEQDKELSPSDLVDFFDNRGKPK